MNTTGDGLYMTDFPIHKTNVGYLPSQGEDLRQYIKRLADVTRQNRYDYTNVHLKFFSHYGVGPCFVCDLWDMCDYVISMVEGVVASDKKGRYICVKTTSSSDPLSFTFERRLSS